MTAMQAGETHKVTIELPEPVYRLLVQIADASHQPLETLAAQSVTGNLHPSVENSPAGLHDELLIMQTLPISELVVLANERIEPADELRHLDLLEKNTDGVLSPQERDELSNLRQAADERMIRQAYAWALLRWRGYRVPPLSSLPIP